MKSKLLSYFQMAAAMTLAGSSVVAGKLITTSLPVFLAAGSSLLVALIILVPLQLLLEGKFSRLDFRDIQILFLQAFTGTFLFRVFVFFGLKYTTASDSGIITSTGPAITGLIAFIFLKEKLSWNKILGIVATVTGIMIINSVYSLPSTIKGHLPLLGNMLVFFAIIGESLFTIFTKVTNDNISPLYRTTIISFFGFMCFLPFTIYDALKTDFAIIDIKVWGLIGYYGVVVTVIAFILWFKGASRVSAGEAGVFTGFIPVGSLLLSAVVLNEKIRPGHMISLGFVLTGIILITVPIKSISANFKSTSCVLTNKK